MHKRPCARAFECQTALLYEILSLFEAADVFRYVRAPLGGPAPIFAICRGSFATVGAHFALRLSFPCTHCTHAY